MVAPALVLYAAVALRVMLAGVAPAAGAGQAGPATSFGTARRRGSCATTAGLPPAPAPARRQPPQRGKTVAIALPREPGGPGPLDM